MKMKIVKKVGLIVLGSLIVQVAVLTFLDKYYLVDNYKFQVTYLDNSSLKENKELQNKLESRDHNYVIYHNEKIIKLVDKKSNETNYISLEEGNRLQDIKWSEDNKQVLITEQSNGNKQLKKYSYDIGKGIKKEIQ